MVGWESARAQALDLCWCIEAKPKRNYHCEDMRRQHTCTHARELECRQNFAPFCVRQLAALHLPCRGIRGCMCVSGIACSAMSCERHLQHCACGTRHVSIGSYLHRPPIHFDSLRLHGRAPAKALEVLVRRWPETIGVERPLARSQPAVRKRQRNAGTAGGSLEVSWPTKICRHRHRNARAGSDVHFASLAHRRIRHLDQSH